RALASPHSEPIASPSGPMCVTIRTRCASATSALASAQSIGILLLFVRCVRRWLWGDVKRLEDLIDPLAALDRHVPVEVQHGYVPQPDTLRQLAPQEPARARQPGH